MYQAAAGSFAGWGGWAEFWVDGKIGMDGGGWGWLHPWWVRNWGTGWWCRWTSPVEVVRVDGVVGMDGGGWSGDTRKRWTGCQQVGNKSIGGGRGGCRWGWGGLVVFQLSSGFHMTGFYWKIGWLHQTRIKSPGQGFWGVLEGVGSRYRVQTVDSLGILGWMVVTVVTVVITMVLVASWKGGGVLGWFPNQNVVWAICNESRLLKPSVDFGNFRVRLNVW